MDSTGEKFLENLLTSPDHIQNGNLQLSIDKSSGDETGLKIRFMNANGEPSNFLYMSGGTCAFKISHLMTHGTYNNPTLGLHGDGNGKYGNPKIENARWKVAYQEKEGGNLSAIEEIIKTQFENLIVKKENLEFVEVASPKLANVMSKPDYTEEKGREFLENSVAYRDPYTVNVKSSEYKGTKSVMYNFGTNVFRKTYKETQHEDAIASYSDDGLIFGVEESALKIDEEFKKKYFKQPIPVIDINKEPIPDEVLQRLKDDGLVALPMVVYAQLAPVVKYEKSAFGIQFYLVKAMIPFSVEDLKEPDIVSRIHASGSSSGPKPLDDPFDFAKPPEAKRAKPNDEEEPTEIPPTPSPPPSPEGVGAF